MRCALQVLLAPAVYPEAFGLIVTEAQLRGIPVVSTDSYGLAEANVVPMTRVPQVPITFDPSLWAFKRLLTDGSGTHELILGMTLEEAEASLSLERPGQLTMEQWRQTAITSENYQKVAEPTDVEPFVALLRKVLQDLQQASQDARVAALSFVERRKGQHLGRIGVYKGAAEVHGRS